MGGSVEERPGGECIMMDGRSSRRGEKGGKDDSCLKWSRNGGSSIEVRMRSRPMSLSE